MLWANFFHIYQPPNWPKRIISKVVKESYRPILKILASHRSLKITLNIPGSLTEQLAEYRYFDIINRIKKLVQKKQIELVGTALYHPILPLLSPQEITRQIKLNTIINKKIFGQSYQPSGFFPPEMSYSRQLAQLIKKMGFKWIIIDEIAANGKLSKLAFQQTFMIKDIQLPVVFRNRMISDYLSFHSKLNAPREFWRAINNDNRSHQYLITGMDGENLGHHRHGLDKYWRKLVTQKNITTTTISQLLKKYPPKKTINPKSSSWSSRTNELINNNPYVLWHDRSNPIHQYQWQLIKKIIQLVNNSQKHEHYRQARQLLDKRLASDQFWWASAKPWWNLRIIKKKTQELQQIAQLFNKHNPQIEKLADKIITTATKWQKTNKFKKIADRYLAAQGDIRYIGGKKIASH